MPKSDQGLSTDRYQVIPRTLIFILNENKVLLIKGSPTKRIWPNMYNGIGGHIEPGEDVLTAAKRELLEETGIKTVSLMLVGTMMVHVEPTSGICLFIFRGNYDGSMLVDSIEGKLEWIDLENVGIIPTPPDLEKLLPVIISMGERSAPFSARSYYDSNELLRVEINRQ